MGESDLETSQKKAKRLGTPLIFIDETGFSLRYINTLQKIDNLEPEFRVKPEYPGGFLEKDELANVLSRQITLERQTG